MFLSLSLSLYIYISSCQYFHPAIDLCLNLSIHLCIDLSIYLSVCPSVCLPACLSVCLAVCLSICLGIYVSSKSQQKQARASKSKQKQARINEAGPKGSKTTLNATPLLRVGPKGHKHRMSIHFDVTLGSIGRPRAPQSSSETPPGTPQGAPRHILAPSSNKSHHRCSKSTKNSSPKAPKSSVFSSLWRTVSHTFNAFLENSEYAIRSCL